MSSCIAKLSEKLLLFVDKHPTISAFFGLTLVLLIVMLLYPFLQPIPISEVQDNVVVSRPFTVIPGKSYDLTVRATKDITFTLREYNQFVTITDVETLTGPTYRQKVTFDVSSPYPGKLKIHYAIFIIDMSKSGQTSITAIQIPIDTVSFPIRLFTSLVLSAPAVHIFVHLLKKTAWFGQISSKPSK